MSRLRQFAAQTLAELAGLPGRVLINSIAASEVWPGLVRTTLYRLAGLRVAWGASVAPGVRLNGRQLSVGRLSTINSGCIIDCRVPVTIGTSVGIGYGVRIITSSHRFDDPGRRAGPSELAPITVEDGCWIGTGATLLAGVQIGAGCIVAAGAVVTKDCAPHGVYAGVPARRLRDLPDTDPGPPPDVD